MALCRSSFLAFVSAIAASTAACGSTTPAPSGTDAATSDAAGDVATGDASGQDAQGATDTGAPAPEDSGADACPPGYVAGLDGGCLVLE